ncbi:MAG: hypothetical protein C0505_13015 [Leptothrix sp. (in: Bacteria)]|nr:hypothetical protein [Leptothrix sp. (in: b-proteobacteria)]
MDASLTAVPASPGAGAPPAAGLAPIATAQRIESLDVVRGFALLGIFLMNIEWFNRAFATIDEGMPRELSGLDWLASWFIAYFVQGKFWTIFSLLFGMGFAVMMVRAEQAGREFKPVYLRRVLALAVFGAAHYIFLWEGDILFSYAVAALMLMVVLYGQPKPLLLAVAAVAALGFIPDMTGFFAIAAGIAVAGLLALYLRNEKRVTLRGRSLPVFSLVLLALGALLCLAAVVFWLLPDGPTEPRGPLSVFGPLALVAGWLSWKYFDPAGRRSLRLGAGSYLFLGLAMTLGGSQQHFTPDPLAAFAPAARSAALAPAASQPGAAMPAGLPASAAASPASTASAEAKKPKKTKAERYLEREAERAKRLAEVRDDKATELRILTAGRYGEAVVYRAAKFPEKVAGDFGFSILLIGMFLLGIGFVRSGVMDHACDHLPLFRRLALWGLPIGIGLGLAGSLIAMSHTPGDRTDGWGIVRGLMMVGSLPACLGYVGLVVLMLHSRSGVSRIRVLAPVGRMALTNYLMQSLICAVYFHGYALGHWGMPRAQQVVFVLVVFAAQVAFSHWWLSKFRYGPLEWFWRGFTYRQVPPLRI